MPKLVWTPCLLFLVACTSPDERRAPDRAQVADGNFEIIVSNQSFEIEMVDVDVYIDGELAIADTFEVGGQHVFVPHTFEVEEGQHTLLASSEWGNAGLTVDFNATADKRWGVLMFWSDSGGEPTPPQFSFHESAEQPLFD